MLVAKSYGSIVESFHRKRLFCRCYGSQKGLNFEIDFHYFRAGESHGSVVFG